MTVKQEGPVVIKEWCKGCGICAAFCPKKVLAMEDGKVLVVNAEACNRCGLCELRCPDYAIYLEEEENDEQKKC